MSIDFVSPSMRAAGSDLTIAISPLDVHGLIELLKLAILYLEGGE